MKSLFLLVLFLGAVTAVNVGYEYATETRHFLFVAKPYEGFTPRENMTCTSTVWSCRLEHPGTWEFSFFSDSAVDAKHSILSATDGGLEFDFVADAKTYKTLEPLVRAQEILIVAPGMIVECVSYDWQCE